MSWWYITTRRVTGAVEVNDDIIVTTPPIWRKFQGQPAKNLGNWLRSKGEVEFKRMAEDNPYYLTHEYAWGNNEKRASLKGRYCRVLSRGARRSVLVEFENGQREIVSYRALRERRTNG